MAQQADQQAQQLQQRLAADPALKAKIAALMKQHADLAFVSGSAAQRDAIRKQLQQLTGFTSGRDLFSPDGWKFTSSGDLERDHTVRNDILKTAAVVGGSLVGGAALNSAVGGTAGGTAAATAPTASTLTPTAATLSQVGTPVTLASAPPAITAGMSPFTRALLTAGVNTGVSVLNSYLQARGVNKAADQMTASIDKAQGLLTDANKQSQANLSPFLNLGTGAANALGALVLGSHFTPSQGGSPALPTTGTPPAAPPPTLTGAGTPAPTPAQTGASLADYAGATGAGQPDPGQQAQAQRQSSYVTLQAPDGSVMQKPASELEHWLSRGAQQIGAA